ncbi:helix-turn-helix domain-containing protein [Streptomyces cyaneofuscatus]|uniref:helix-turn-helix domain-containing protein n=1 Tax=Streptomyces cyaneofuscatus TaxID=66883 RepID=UPI003CEFDC62
MSTSTTAAPPAEEPTDSSTSAGSGLRRIPKGRQLTGEDAERFTQDVIKAYKTRSIRSICEETGRSYGAIHRLLRINNVTMRPKGYQRRMPTGSVGVS